jgi:hypothetical protein
MLFRIPIMKYPARCDAVNPKTGPHPSARVLGRGYLFPGSRETYFDQLGVDFWFKIGMNRFTGTNERFVPKKLAPP